MTGDPIGPRQGAGKDVNTRNYIGKADALLHPLHIIGGMWLPLAYPAAPDATYLPTDKPRIRSQR